MGCTSSRPVRRRAPQAHVNHHQHKYHQHVPPVVPDVSPPYAHDDSALAALAMVSYPPADVSAPRYQPDNSQLEEHPEYV